MREREGKQKPLKETETQQKVLCEKLKARGKLPIDEAFHLFTFSIDFTLEKTSNEWREKTPLKYPVKSWQVTRLQREKKNIILRSLFLLRTFLNYIREYKRKLCQALFLT